MENVSIAQRRGGCVGGRARDSPSTQFAHFHPLRARIWRMSTEVPIQLDTD